MIAYLTGTIKYLGANYIILLTKEGIGYKVFIPNVTGYKLHVTGEFFIYHHIREDRQELYGFATMEELQLFELLLTVNGVGPKMASNILSKTNSEKLKSAISQGEVTLLTAISGVGKKIAQKILLELKNKLGNMDYDINALEGSDSLDALESLGYKKAEVYPYLAKMPQKLETTEEKVKWLLKNLKN